MDRRRFLIGIGSGFLSGGLFVAQGCRGRDHQFAHVLNGDDRDMVGSHSAGAETWEPLIQTSVCKLLDRQARQIQQVSHEGQPVPKRVCFVGVENKSAEEMGDFRELIFQKIDQSINETDSFEMLNKRFVEAGLRTCGLRPDDLFVPRNRGAFIAAMEQQNQPFDYLLYATINSGTTTSNKKDSQRNYLLTLELINLETGRTDKESAELRKGYHKSRFGSLKHYG